MQRSVTGLLAAASLAVSFGCATTGAGETSGESTSTLSTPETLDATAADAEVPTTAASQPTTAPTTTEAPTTTTTAPPPPVVPELEFSGPTLDGGTLTGTDYAGTDTVLWFWAPW